MKVLLYILLCIVLPPLPLLLRCRLVLLIISLAMCMTVIIWPLAIVLSLIAPLIPNPLQATDEELSTILDNLGLSQGTISKSSDEFR